KVAVAYQVGSERRETYPADLADIAQAEPIYRDFEGWTEDLTGLRRIEQLPPAARRYIDFLEERIGAPIAEVSVGPDRSQMIPRAR
ncbi:MAG: adenylosuccinate synthetase, partial [Bryobacterales bacterium]|nr:adenylosuccinate synthetase [Bryobacterales bacterium]